MNAVFRPRADRRMRRTCDTSLRPRCSASVELRHSGCSSAFTSISRLSDSVFRASNLRYRPGPAVRAAHAWKPRMPSAGRVLCIGGKGCEHSWRRQKDKPNVSQAVKATGVSVLDAASERARDELDPRAVTQLFSNTMILQVLRPARSFLAPHLITCLAPFCPSILGRRFCSTSASLTAASSTAASDTAPSTASPASPSPATPAPSAAVPSSSTSPRRGCGLLQLGSAPYDEVWALQKGLASDLAARDAEDALIVVEHPPVFTLGRGSKVEHLKFDEASPPYPLLRVERGGQVTFHGPGQLVAYPILDLHHHKQDLRWYVGRVEEVLVRTLGEFGIAAGRKDDLTGVWVGDVKVGFVGISCSRWITMHGISLNVCPDMAPFGMINPCGILAEDYSMGSMADYVPGVAVADVEPVLVRHFREVFEVDLRDLDV